MGEMHTIVDANDGRLSDYVGLRDPDRRRVIEAELGFFIAESGHVIENVVRAGPRVRSVLVTPHQLEALRDLLARVDAPVYVAPPHVLREIVGFDLHRGAVAALERWPLPSVASVLESAARVAIVERVNDHENLGVLFRNAAAFGIDAVLLDAQCADPLYRRCVRVSIGHVCTVPWTRYESLSEVRDAGFTVFALTPARDAQSIESVVWPQRCAVMVGAEGPGLSDQALTEADARVRIPMRDGVDSLNVATAAAVAFHRCTDLGSL